MSLSLYRTRCCVFFCNIRKIRSPKLKEIQKRFILNLGERNSRMMQSMANNLGSLSKKKRKCLCLCVRKYGCMPFAKVGHAFLPFARRFAASRSRSLRARKLVQPDRPKPRSTESRITRWSSLLARKGASAENSIRETVCKKGALSIP